jgi:hypothetical protein
MNNKYRLTKNQIEIITQEVIKQLDKQQKKQQKQKKDWRLRNTKLLLENYQLLKEHCNEIEQEFEEYEDTMFSLEEFTLESLMKYRVKTAKMMRHFDRMLKFFEEDSLKGTEEDKRRFNVIYHRYLSGNKLTVQKLCKELNVEQTTVYRDSKHAINNISVLLFGLLALDTSRF